MNNERSELGSQPSQDGVRIETINGRQELIVPGRFEVSWSPSTIDARNPQQIVAFQRAMVGLLSHMHDELSSDESRKAEAIARRADAAQALGTMLQTPGVSVAYNDRNTRYTSMDGSHFMPEEIIPGNGMDKHSGQGGIPNPLNIPESSQP